LTIADFLLGFPTVTVSTHFKVFDLLKEPLMFGSVLGLLQVLSEAIEVSDHLLFLAALDPIGFDKLHLFFGRLSEIQLLDGYCFEWVELF